ncbi:hypothetical protein Y1Q_0001072 [Alligator mississippiensis]|uniref:Uncharacterized protein n=1 Tax=Alligator mississippiensis TaxID=8496 RepID=A0A151NF77_ALLMI|nr:hypothetical protein Y1Q_0001072 [Alligator mississippiensis]
MSQLYGDCSLLPDDHDCQEELLVTIHLMPLSHGPWTSRDNEAEEVEGQKETRVADTSSSATETKEHAGPASCMYVLDKKEEIEKRRNVAPPPHHRWVDGVRHDTIPQPSSQQSQCVTEHPSALHYPFQSTPSI